MRAWRLMVGLTAGCVVLAAGPVQAEVDLELFDANPRYTSNVFLPIQPHDGFSVQLLTTQAWTDHARPISRVAADGVSLVVARINFPAGGQSQVHVTVASDVADADPGTVWTLDDHRVVDTTPDGGVAVVGNPAIDTPSRVVGSGRPASRFAFVLYRAPRDFDTANGSTGSLASRTVKITATTPDQGSATVTVTVVRPLVVFIHGTFSDNDAWRQFPLWRNSANEIRGFAPGALPFHATRISFNWIWNATGGVIDNAATILPQLVTALRDWREATGTAATQADVITHSFGGFIARQVVQTQEPEQGPLSTRPLHSFRSAENWGHGSIHKLITLAATHRGAATGNAIADLNHNAFVVGQLRYGGCLTGEYIDKGAARDQLVLSKALMELGETRVPGHAFAGSGTYRGDPSNELSNLLNLMIPFLTEPYTKAYNTNTTCGRDALTNYIFNRDADVPHITATCDLVPMPNYDGIVSSDSSLGLMPPGATTTAEDLGLAKVLVHSGFISPASDGTPDKRIVPLVSGRVEFLLKQATTSAYFSYFPAVGSARSDIEKELSQIKPEWLETGIANGPQCPDRNKDTSHCPGYTALRVVPASLQLEDTTPTPLNVYGFSDQDGWVLAYSYSTRNCPVTLVSQAPAVATIATNDKTGAQTVVAAGIGATQILVTVHDNKGNVIGTVDVPLTVTGLQ